MTKAEKKAKKAELRKQLIERDGYKCLRCGKKGVLHASHIYPVGLFRWMEFLLDNLKLLCYRCHFHFWHKDPVNAAIWYSQTIPLKRRNKLKKIAQNGKEKNNKNKKQKSG